MDKESAERITKMRAFISERFRDILIPGRDANKLRAHAEDALDKLLIGDVAGADASICKLDLRGAVEFRRKIAELDLLPKNAGLPPE